MTKAKDFLNERVKDLETGNIGLVVEVDEEAGKVGYVSKNPKTGTPEITWQTIEKIVLLLPAIWKIIRTIVLDVMEWISRKKKKA